jgi:hypothetical protein
MRTRALLYFRRPPWELKARLPAGLQFLAPKLTEVGPGRTRADLELSPAQFSELVEWGRTRVGGATLLRIARLDHRYERQELGSDHAELFRDPSNDSAEVRNPSSAFEARWICTHCDRVDMTQVGPLEVEGTNSDADLQLTETYEVLLASQFANVAERANASVRPLLGRVDFVQLVAPPTVTLLPIFPLFAVGEACPGCGRFSYDRSDQVEGQLSVDEDTGLTIAQEWPLTLNAGVEAIARSKERVAWRGTETEEPRHVIGEALDLLKTRGWDSGVTVNIVGLKLVDALLRAGARMPPLRPILKPQAGATSQ